MLFHFMTAHKQYKYSGRGISELWTISKPSRGAQGAIGANYQKSSNKRGLKCGIIISVESG